MDITQLRTQLADSSARFARSALQAHADDPATFLLHAATSLEHLAKATLAARHPSLIVAANDYESLLHACGQPSLKKRPRARGMVTINAREAINRACHFVPALTPLVTDLDLLIMVRNGVVHLGEASTSAVDDILVPYLQASEELRASLIDLDRDSYWGEFIGIVDSALGENVQRARMRVETALAIARQEFKRRFGTLEDAARETMLRVITMGHAPAGYDEQLLNCPACNIPALVSGSVETEFDEDWDHRDRILLGVHASFTFIPSKLRCMACGLGLDGRDELGAAGVDGFWELDVDEHDFFESPEDWSQ